MAYWDNISTDHQYFKDRLEDPYRSTLALETFAAEQGFFSMRDEGTLIADVACGMGSETAWLAKRHPHLDFMGVDLEPHFIHTARSRYSMIRNLSFVTGDLNAVHEVPDWLSVRAVWFSQTLSWLPWWRDALGGLLSPGVEKIAFSTLSWNSPVESEVKHYLRGRQEDALNDFVYYNVYSNQHISQFMHEKGFTRQVISPFEIDIDLGETTGTNLGSYTIRDENRRRWTFSLWQHLPWHFFYFARM